MDLIQTWKPSSAGLGESPGCTQSRTGWVPDMDSIHCNRTRPQVAIFWGSVGYFSSVFSALLLSSNSILLFPLCFHFMVMRNEGNILFVMLNFYVLFMVANLLVLRLCFAFFGMGFSFFLIVLLFFPSLQQIWRSMTNLWWRFGKMS